MDIAAGHGNAADPDVASEAGPRDMATQSSAALADLMPRVDAARNEELGNVYLARAVRRQLCCYSLESEFILLLPKQRLTSQHLFLFLPSLIR